MSENMEKAVAEVKSALPGMTLLENEPMALHSSFKIGGPVRAVCYPSSVFAASKICAILKQNHLFPMIIGNCTNVLFPDGALDVFIICTEKLNKVIVNGDGTIYAECGVSLARLAGVAQQNGLAGLEFASGIPGTLGGGIRMNAGAYGGEMKDVIDSVVYYFLPDQGLYEVKNADCNFAYRKSIFQTQPAVIFSAVLSLRDGDKDEIAAKMRELNEKRRSKQPLDLPSAGSAFRRPEGYYAAALIEECGLKGYRVGGAQVSEKHAGFVVNTGGATAKDVYDLMMHVRNTVAKEKNVFMEPEIIMLPPDADMTDNSPPAPKTIVTTPEGLGTAMEADAVIAAELMKDTE